MDKKFAPKKGIARQGLPLGGAKSVTEVCRLFRSLSDLRTKSVKVTSMEGRGLTKLAKVCRPKFVQTLSKSNGKHSIRPRAKNQLTFRKKITESVAASRLG